LIGMDSAALKGRIAEAFVENILRRAGYRVSRVGRETQTQRLLKINDDEFLPDFLAWKAVPSPGLERRLHRLLMIEVKYRAGLADYLRGEGHAVFRQVSEQWPELYFVLVTDRPDDGRSCFQVVDLATYDPGRQIATVDLHDVPDLDIFPSTVAEYESLVRSLFSLLSGAPAPELPRKPQAKMGEGNEPPAAAAPAG
jgi:hypothetical protein